MWYTGMWSIRPVEINQNDITMVTHYDITIGNDIARDAHCEITMGNDVTRNFHTGSLSYTKRYTWYKENNTWLKWYYEHILWIKDLATRSKAEECRPV